MHRFDDAIHAVNQFANLFFSGFFILFVNTKVSNIGQVLNFSPNCHTIDGMLFQRVIEVGDGRIFFRYDAMRLRKALKMSFQHNTGERAGCT